MSYLIDADWIISFLNGRPNAVELMTELADEGIAVSIITCGEIYDGLLTKSGAPHHMSQFERFTATIDLIAPDNEVARQYAKIRSHLRSQGLLIPDNDLWIAATALAHKLTLVSRDQHFSRIPDLDIYQVS